MSDDAAGARAKKPKREEKKVESDDGVPDTSATQKSQRPAVVISVKSGARTVKPGTPVDDDRSLTVGDEDIDWEYAYSS
jgi:hypothetical protein